MEEKVIGRVLSAKKQWWLKINTKIVRRNALDGAIFPHIVKVEYTVGEKTYQKRKWIKAGLPVPKAGEEVVLFYKVENPKKIRIEN